MLTTEQSERFAKWMNDDIEDGSLTISAIDSAITWMNDNLLPDEVFEIKKMQECARENYAPQDLFDKEMLIDWAVTHGFKAIDDVTEE